MTSWVVGMACASRPLRRADRIKIASDFALEHTSSPKLSKSFDISRPSSCCALGGRLPQLKPMTTCCQDTWLPQELEIFLLPRQSHELRMLPARPHAPEKLLRVFRPRCTVCLRSKLIQNSRLF